ncbi:MAG: hypothetical protein JSS02_23845 [Planctomycetes bacterium]|nr:hypothetical protein [Planctomycetota bacterium]
MLRCMRLSLGLLLVFNIGIQVQAAESGLDAVSQDAALVIRLKNPKATVGKVAELADQVVPGIGDQVRSQIDLLGNGISNPTMAGVDSENDWYIGMFTKKVEGASNDEPVFLFVIPATDLKAMKEGLGESFKFAEHGKLGVYTTDEATFKAASARIKGDGKSISTLIEKDSAAVFDAGDLSVFINVKQLLIDYKDELAEGKEKFKQQLENLPTPPAGGVNPAQVAEIANKVIQMLSEGLEDTESCTIGTVVSKEGLSFDDLVKVKKGSATEKLLNKSPASTLATFSTLPAGHLGYFGLSWDMADLMKMSQSMMAVGANSQNAEASKELKAAMEEAAKLKVTAMASAFGLGDPDTGAVRTVSITEVDNPQKMRDASQKMMKASEKVASQGVKQTFDLKKDAEKFGKNSADVVTVKMDMSEMPDPTAAQMSERVMAGLFGPDGMVTRVVYLKDRVVQTMGGGKQAMTDALAATEQGATGSSKSAYVQARGKLGAKANLVVLFDLPNTLAKILDLVVQAQVLPLPLDPNQVKGLQSSPSYIGLSAGVEPQGLRVKTLIPVEQMQGIAKIVMFFQQTLGGVGQ